MKAAHASLSLTRSTILQRHLLITPIAAKSAPIVSKYTLLFMLFMLKILGQNCSPAD